MEKLTNAIKDTRWQFYADKDPKESISALKKSVYRHIENTTPKLKPDAPKINFIDLNKIELELMMIGLEAIAVVLSGGLDETKDAEVEE